MTRHKGTQYLWSDGIHYVRPATVKDRHPMRFVVNAHRVTASDHKRHAPDEQAAISAARAATDKWLEKHPEDARHIADGAIELVQQAFSTQGRRKRSPKANGGSAGISATHESIVAHLPKRKVVEPVTPKVALQPFAITHFDCIIANPHAQVWQCTSQVGSKAPVGRRKADGRPAEQTPVLHAVGECAVLIGDQPMRHEDGRVIVYRTWFEAEEVALEQYLNAPEDEVISWKPGDKKVGATPRLDILFDPDVNGVKKPFSLWLPGYNKPVVEMRTKGPPMDSKLPSAEQVGAGVRLQMEELRRQQRAMDRRPTWEERPRRFRSIYEALACADRVERRLNGENIEI